MMGGRGGGSPASRQAPAATVTPAAPSVVYSDDVSLPLKVRIAAALEELRRANGQDRSDFQRIDQIHDKLSDIPSKVLNRALFEMGSTDRSVVLNPQSNQKILTTRQRATAVHMGDQEKHLIKLMPRGRDALLPSGMQ